MGLERKSSIDSEPRTLNLRQIEVAREAALLVMNTSSLEEALRIFTAGLKPVTEGGCSRREDEYEERCMDAYEEYEEFEDCSESKWMMIKDVSSAPF